MSYTKGLLSPSPLAPLHPQGNLVRRPTESKFELENNTAVCSPKRKKKNTYIYIYFQSCVSEHTQLCDFLIDYMPTCLQTALSSLLLS